MGDMDNALIESLQAQLDETLDVKAKVDLLHELAWETKSSNPEQSRIWCKTAYDLLSEQLPKYKKGFVDNKVILSYHHIYGSRFAEALEILTNAENFYTSINDKLALVRTWSLFLNNYYGLGNRTLELEYALKLLQLAQELNDEASIANAHQHIGIVYDIEGEYEKAIESYSVALNHYQLLDDKNRIAITLDNMIKSYRGLKQYDHALDTSERAYDYHVQVDSWHNMAVSLGIRGHIYTDMGNYESALACHFQKLELAKKLDSDYLRGYTFGDIGHVLTKQNKPEDALPWLESSIEISEKTGNTYSLSFALEAIVATYKALDDYESALRYHEKWAQMREEFHNQRLETERNNLIVLHETKQAQLEAQLQRERAEQFQTLAENSPDLIIRFAHDETCLYANSATIETMGIDAETIVGMTINDLSPSPSIKAFIQGLHKTVFETGQMHQAEFSFRTAKQEYCFHVVAVPEFDIDNKVASVLFINRDITLHKQAEKEAKETTIRNERQRIARELHDVISQQLFSASMISQSLPHLLKTDIDAVHEGLEELIDLTLMSSAEMRVLLLELRPDTFSQTPLDTLLKSLIESFSSHHTDINFTVEFDCFSIPLIEDTKLNIYRIVQESLNNIAKHAFAKNVHVTLRCAEDSFQLVLQDDGKGFDLDATRATSMGLKIMDERAKESNLILDIHSQSGEGTRITLCNEGRLNVNE